MAIRKALHLMPSPADLMVIVLQLIEGIVTMICVPIMVWSVPDYPARGTNVSRFVDKSSSVQEHLLIFLIAPV